MKGPFVLFPLPIKPSYSQGGGERCISAWYTHMFPERDNRFLPYSSIQQHPCRQRNIPSIGEITTNMVNLFGSVLAKDTSFSLDLIKFDRPAPATGRVTRSPRPVDPRYTILLFSLTLLPLIKVIFPFWTYFDVGPFERGKRLIFTTISHKAAFLQWISLKRSHMKLTFLKSLNYLIK